MAKQIQLKDLPRRPEHPIKIYYDKGKYVLYHHVDGMYSYCTDPETEEVTHLSVGTPLLQINDGYKII